jgi:hypothetical protein
MIKASKYSFSYPIASPKLSAENSTLEEWFKKEKQKKRWVKCDYGTIAGSREVDDDWRNCFTYSEQVPLLDINEHSNDNINECFNKIGIKYNLLSLVDNDILWYKKGGHFTLHKDGIIKSNKIQLGTILYIGYSPDAIGGELIIENQVIAKNSSTNEWTWCFIFVARDDLHEVTQLKTGNRIVYRQTLMSKNDILRFFTLNTANETVIASANTTVNTTDISLNNQTKSIIKSEERCIIENLLKTDLKTGGKGRINKTTVAKDTQKRIYETHFAYIKKLFVKENGELPCVEDKNYNEYMNKYNKYIKVMPISYPKN